MNAFPYFVEEMYVYALKSYIVSEKLIILLGFFRSPISGSRRRFFWTSKVFSLRKLQFVVALIKCNTQGSTEPLTFTKDRTLSRQKQKIK